MRDSDNPPIWSVSKAQAAQLTICFVALGLAEAIASATPIWTALPLVLAFLSGVWCMYRLLSDLKLARSNHHVQTTPQAHIQPARATSTTKPSLFVSDSTDSPY